MQAPTAQTRRSLSHILGIYSISVSKRLLEHQFYCWRVGSNGTTNCPWKRPHIIVELFRKGMNWNMEGIVSSCILEL
ncbi:hypothetical protein V6N11_026563 [Hibiscus sabdariffa]|uniref:Uncharacterized protein n=1 Tax=Hibiscus sabdariffa TaxID=183260 RepID=A0ABR2SW24_9ROSI